MKKTTYRRLKDAGVGVFEPAIHLDVFRKIDARLTNVKDSRRVFLASMGDICCKAYFHVTDARKEGLSTGAVTVSVSRNAMATRDVLERIRKFCGRHKRHTFLLLSKNPQAFKAFEWSANVHVGTSFDHMDEIARSRLDALYGVMAAVRWVSIEPLLDPEFDPEGLERDGHRPSWAVVGGLSGKESPPAGCRQAADRIVKWCQNKGVPVFVKNNLPPLDDEWPQQYP